MLFKVLFACLLIAATVCYAQDAGMACGDSSCLANEQCCGGFCYDSNFQVCINDTVCQMNESLCGTHCFNSDTQICFDNQVVCAMNEQRCGMHDCYDPNVSNCHDLSLVCGKNDQICIIMVEWIPRGWSFAISWLHRFREAIEHFIRTGQIVLPF